MFNLLITRAFIISFSLLSNNTTYPNIAIDTTDNMHTNINLINEVFNEVLIKYGKIGTIKAIIIQGMIICFT